MNDSHCSKTGVAVVREPATPPRGPYLLPAAARDEALQAQVRQLNAAIDLLYDALFSPAGRARKDGLR